MPDLRTLLAAVLGVALGAVCLAFPDAVLRAQTAGRRPHDAGGEYGSAGTPPARWRRLVRLFGAVAVLAGGYFAVTAFP
ncbi:MAG: hypothetical protein ABEJ61_10490 [Haloferacaceae archaeon]